MELVERMQSKLRSVLGTVLNQTHPDRPGLFDELLHKIPDLRTLNTLHSEKLLAFKMTEQQQQQQQQLQQQQQHPMHHSLAQFAHGHAHQPASPWHDSYDEEGAKSPMGSVSSSESVCSAGEAMSDLPLLAAVAGSAAPLVAVSRRRPRGPSHSENGSMSSDGEENDTAIAMMMESPPRSCPYKGRKLDSPDDSGIESGVDRYEKLSTTSRSTNTSLCSSPRSSLEDKVKEVDDVSMGSVQAAGPSPRSASSASGGPSASSVDDMPVLKRVLQAPPLFDTNLLMDEAYKPHKKFRALTLQRKGGEESVPVSVVTSVRAAVSAASNAASSSPSRATTPQSSPSVLSAALNSPPGSSYSALCSALTSSPSTASSLTSTHSTLARSLMEGPKLMNSEHQRRADLIVANIMKGTGVGSMCASSLSPMSTSSSPSPTPSSSSTSSYSTQSYAGSPYSPQKTVLTSGPLYNGQSSSSSPSSWHPYQRPPVAPSAQSINRMVYESAHHSGPMASPAGSSPSHHRGSPLLAHSPRSTPQASSSVVELQVGIASDSQPQPLNLSLKSPSSSPARSTTPVTHAHYFPLHA